MKSIKQKSLANKRHRYRILYLEHYDIKAPLAASLHQALKIFELKKSKSPQGSMTDHRSAVTE